MIRKRRNLVLLSAALLGLAAVLVVALTSSDVMGRLLRGTAGSRGSVAVTTFAGWSEQGAAHIQWQTDSETDIVGFLLYQSESDGASYEQLTQDPIPSQAPGGGGTYNFVNSEVVAGQTYFYKLESVDSLGTINEHGPISIMIYPISALPPNFGYRIFLPTISSD